MIIFVLRRMVAESGEGSSSNSKLRQVSQAQWEANYNLAFGKKSVDREDQELAKVVPAGVDVKRFEDNNATISSFISGQVQVIATGASVAGTIMNKNPGLNTEYKLLLKDSPNFIGVGKGEDKLRLKVNEIIAQARKAGDIDKMSQKWLGRPAGDLPL